MSSTDKEGEIGTQLGRDGWLVELQLAVRDLKLGHGHEAFPIFGSSKMYHHLGYPYINNQCSSLVDITYVNYRCHEPERIEASIGGSVLEIFGLVRWMFMDAHEASLRLATGLTSDQQK